MAGPLATILPHCSYCPRTVRTLPHGRKPESPNIQVASYMPSGRRVLLAVAIGISAGLIILVAEQAIRNYPSPDGVSLADGTLLGGDFVAFYVGGRLFDVDRSRLYDLEYQREFRIELLGLAGGAPEAELPFVYPPLIAALATPISRLPFQQAFLLWTLLGLMVSVSSLLLLMRSSGATEVLPLPLLLLFSFGFVPFSMNTVLGGQASWLGMAILAAVSIAILRERDYLAGVAMSLSYYKPPLFLFLFIVLALARGRRFVLGFLSGAVFLMAVTVLLVGTGGLFGFLDAASRYVYGQEVYLGMEVPQGEGMGLAALGLSLTSSLPITLASLALPFFGLVWLGYRLLRSREASETLFGLTLSITASLGLSVYILKYDLALLLIPMVLGVAWYGRGGDSRKAATLVPFAGFYFEFVFRQVPLGGGVLNASPFVFTLLLGVLGWQGWRILKAR
jgi:hypothetical protein